MGEYRFLEERDMANILMSECPWCDQVYIKDKIDSPHGCPQEKTPEAHVKEAVEVMQESITIYAKR